MADIALLVSTAFNILLGGGGLVALYRARTQNRNETIQVDATKEQQFRDDILARLSASEAKYDTATERLDRLSAANAELVAVNAANTERLRHQAERSQIQDQRIDGLADQVTVATLLRERMLVEMETLRGELAHVEAENAQLRTDHEILRLKHEDCERVIGELRRTQQGDVATNTAAVQENTTATQLNTEARSDG